MNELVEKEKIENMIYEIRGKQVMFSSDVAKLYKVEPKALNQTIKRNIARFPETFCFQLTPSEVEALSSRSQFVTLNKSNNLRGYNIKYLPYVLTEEGIMMLSGLLKSDIAAKINVQIIEAFVTMRKYISNNLLEQKYINEIVFKDSKRIDLLEEMFTNFKENNNEIYYEGQIYECAQKRVSNLVGGNPT